MCSYHFLTKTAARGPMEAEDVAEELNDVLPSALIGGCAQGRVLCVSVRVRGNHTFDTRRVCGGGGTALRGQRSENGRPGALGQAGREGCLTVLLKSLGGLWSIESFPPAHPRFSSDFCAPSSPSLDLLFSLEGVQEPSPGNHKTVPQLDKCMDS